MHLTQVGETRTETTSAGYPAPEIVEFYRDYIPPVDVKRTVEEMVASVPSKYLTGLKTILLTNSAALTRDQRRQKIFQRGRNHKLVEARGWYSRATRSRQASVAVIVNNTLGNLPLAMLRIPFFCHLFIGEVLFHEIGHHIHATYKPVHDGKENVAEDWSRRLALLHVKRRFWYLFPFIRFLAFVKKTKTRILRWSRRSVTVGGKL